MFLYIENDCLFCMCCFVKRIQYVIDLPLTFKEYDKKNFVDSVESELLIFTSMHKKSAQINYK